MKKGSDAERSPRQSAYLRRVLSIAFDGALIVAAIEVLGLLFRVPAARTLTSTLLLGVSAFGAGTLAALPVAALIAISFRNEPRARQIGALWWSLSAVVTAGIAYSERVLLLGLARDYGWGQAAGAVGLGLVLLGLPASFLVRSEPILRRRALAHGLSALLVALIAAEIALGLQVFVRMDPPLHCLLGFGSVACVVLVRALLHDGHRPPWLAASALGAGVALMLPAVTADPVVHAHAAHRGLLLADLLHLVNPVAQPLPPMSAPHRAAAAAAPVDRTRSIRPRLVLLITVDALRYDIASSERLPTFSSLRARSIEFTQARSSAGYTLASMYSLMTGRGPWQIPWRELGAGRGRAKPMLVPGMDGTPTLAQTLARQGYQTAMCGVMLPQTPGWGLSTGFERIDLSIYQKRNQDSRGITADLVDDCALRMIDRSRDKPLFLWLHYFDPHGPYSLHEGIEVDEHEPLDRYRGEVLFVDRHLGELLRDLEPRVPRDDTLLVIASDHGEEFGDHGGTAHVYSLYEETLRVPLLIAAPGLGARRVEAPVSLMDVAPTLSELLGAPSLPGADGVSLVRAMLGEPLPSRPLFAETVRLSRSQRAILDGDYKLIYDSRLNTYELFNLVRDPGEQSSLVGALPDVTAALARDMGLQTPHE